MLLLLGLVRFGAQAQVRTNFLDQVVVPAPPGVTVTNVGKRPVILTTNNLIPRAVTLPTNSAPPVNLQTNPVIVPQAKAEPAVPIVVNTNVSVAAPPAPRTNIALPTRPAVLTNAAPTQVVTAPQTTNELEQAVRKLRVADGFRVELFAAEPLIQNPVSFAFDEQGRAFVVETHRRRTSVFDIRNHPDWLTNDFSFRTVLDRSNFFRQALAPGKTNVPEKLRIDRNQDGRFDSADLEVESERLRLVEDRNADGVAETASTFAEGFNSLVSGVAAGVLPRKGDVYFACIPDLWILRDQNGDRTADIRAKLLSGFGVHISYGGHDLHGLKFGPDGKLYFSIADRGLHVVTGDGRTNSLPDTGAIMRCNPDGTEFEIVATGFRNPQELAFDQHGNLWTGENNGDGGDKARWLYVVEGGDYGWHIGWQHLPKMGAWNSEMLWSMPPTNTAYQIIPPIAHIGHGPAGLAFYPGTGLPPQYANHFFMCDFPGGVNAFSVESSGAGFEVRNARPVLSELYPVDVDFGPRGGFYVLDWVQGWEKTGKGRLFRVAERSGVYESAAVQAAQLLSTGMDNRAVEELGNLLAHADMRVRLEAQFTLAAKGTSATNVLVQVATSSQNELARLHSIWALGQIGRKDQAALTILLGLAGDPSAEVRAQSLKVMGEARYGLGYDLAISGLRDTSPRVRFFAALALGRIGMADPTPLYAMLAENNDKDPFLRHAGVTALTWLEDFGMLETGARDRSPAVRLASLLAMRRLGRSEVALFLYDNRAANVLEAARAIYEEPIESGMNQLAALIDKPILSEFITRRILHANYRLGKLENALALSEFVGRTNLPAHLRAEAIELLGRWGENSPRDLFTGLWRPLPARDARAASITVRSSLSELLHAPSTDLRRAAISAAVRLDLNTISPELLRIASSTNEPGLVRLDAFKALSAFKAPEFQKAVALLSNDPDFILRKEASAFTIKQAAPANALQVISKILQTGSIPEKQQAIEQLGNLESSAADPLLLMWLDRVVSGKAPPELHAEILEAASKRADPLIKGSLERYLASRGKENVTRDFSEALAGGNAESGRKIFFERQDVACVRCHKLGGQGGGEVGPELTGIGARVDRQYLLESIVAPNARLTSGFENLLITLRDKSTVTGLLREDDLEYVYITSPEDGDLRVPKSEIENLDLGLSSMPEEIGKILTKRELRDLIEFLAQQK